MGVSASMVFGCSQCQMLWFFVCAGVKVVQVPAPIHKLSCAEGQSASRHKTASAKRHLEPPVQQDAHLLFIVETHLLLHNHMLPLPLKKLPSDMLREVRHTCFLLVILVFALASKLSGGIRDNKRPLFHTPFHPLVFIVAISC